jgi:hypothetical protein
VEFLKDVTQGRSVGFLENVGADVDATIGVDSEQIVVVGAVVRRHIEIPFGTIGSPPSASERM